MSKTKITSSTSFLIKGIELVEFNMFVPEIPFQEIKTYNFNIQVEQKISFEHKLILVLTSVEILNDTKETKLGSIKVSVIFEISNFDDYIDNKSQNLILPDDIIFTFNTIGISTTRGVMFSQFKGTFLHNAFLPAIDYNQLNKAAQLK